MDSVPERGVWEGEWGEELEIGLDVVVGEEWPMLKE